MQKQTQQTRKKAEPGALTAALFAAAVLSAEAASPNWIGNSGTWDDTTTANWSTATIPQSGDTVTIGQSGVTVDYTATPAAAPGFSALTLNHTGDGVSTLNLDGSDHLRVDGKFSVGEYSVGAWELNISGSAILELDGLQGIYLGGNASNTVVNHSGGAVTCGVTQAALFYVKANATYNLSGTGRIKSNRGLTINAGGTWNQTGGEADWWTTAGTVINGVFVLSSGTFIGGNLVLGAGGSGTWTGGSLPAPGSGGSLQLTGAAACWTQKGGTMTINVAGTSGANTLVVAAGATVQGYGTIQDHRYGLSSPGTFSQSGRIVANGYGADNTLDLSRFGQTPSISKLVNPTDNTDSNGWFAASGGKLVLPAVGVSAGDQTNNWGEAADDTTIDLVNSARLAFSGASAGTLTGSLLATGRTDVARAAPANNTFVSVHEFAYSSAPGSVTVTIRYDDAAVQAAGLLETDLKLWHDSGAAWVEITAGVDTVNKRITGAAVGTLGQFAVAAFTPPPAGTLITIR